METEDAEDTAISELDGARWMGRVLKVNKAKPREDRRSPMGGGGGNRDSFSRRSDRRY